MSSAAKSQSLQRAPLPTTTTQHTHTRLFRTHVPCAHTPLTPCAHTPLTPCVAAPPYPPDAPDPRSASPFHPFIHPVLLERHTLMDLNMTKEGRVAPKRRKKAAYGVKDEAEPRRKLQSGGLPDATEEPKGTTEPISSKMK
eukprot:353679-Chlamydomonas_euryale.AAC.1